MALVATPIALPFPNWRLDQWEYALANTTMDAASERIAHIGELFIVDRSASKVLSAAGGGSISFRTGAVTFADAGTSIDVGIQDVATGAGPVARPDDAFDVSRTLTVGSGGMAPNAWNTVTMTGGAGSKTMVHGGLYAVVWDMTARGGADTVSISGLSPDTSAGGTTGHRSTANVFTGGAWASIANTQLANVVIEFDDGTLGYLLGPMPISATATLGFADSSSPDEYGLMFQVPWACTVEMLSARLTVAGATSDFKIGLYSDPTGTPVLMTSSDVLGEQMGRVDISLMRWVNFMVPAVNLTPGATYGVTVKAAGAGNVTLSRAVLGSADYRAFANGGTTLAQITRNGGAGAFTAEDPAVTLPLVALGLSHLDNGVGGGGGGIRIAGRGGLAMGA
jgi:hypothetical protein